MAALQSDELLEMMVTYLLDNLQPYIWTKKKVSWWEGVRGLSGRMKGKGEMCRTHTGAD